MHDHKASVAQPMGVQPFGYLAGLLLTGRKARLKRCLFYAGAGNDLPHAIDDMALANPFVGGVMAVGKTRVVSNAFGYAGQGAQQGGAII